MLSTTENNDIIQGTHTESADVTRDSTDSSSNTGGSGPTPTGDDITVPERTVEDGHGGTQEQQDSVSTELTTTGRYSDDHNVVIDEYYPSCRVMTLQQHIGHNYECPYYCQ